MRWPLLLVLPFLLFGCGKKAASGPSPEDGPTDLVSYDLPAGDLSGMTPYREPIPGIEMGVAPGWMGYDAPTILALIRHADPQPHVVTRNVVNLDPVVLYDYNPSAVRDEFVPVLSMKTVPQKSTSLEDAVKQYLALQSSPGTLRRLGNQRLPGGTAARFLTTVTGQDFLHRRNTIPMRIWLFASADTLYFVQLTAFDDQTDAPADVERMLKALRFRRPNPHAQASTPPMPPPTTIGEAPSGTVTTEHPEPTKVYGPDGLPTDRTPPTGAQLPALPSNAPAPSLPSEPAPGPTTDPTPPGSSETGMGNPPTTPPNGAPSNGP